MIESANSTSVVERYQALVRRAFLIIKYEAPDLDNEATVQMAVESVNDSVGPDGLLPTLLVFSSIPGFGPLSHSPTPSSMKRALAL